MEMLQGLRLFSADSFDSVVCDPPYGLKFMGKRWDYDVPKPEEWAEVLRVLKPGGHVVAFGGTRTYHRLVCAMEDGGFEIRDQVGWVYGSGFPKSHNGEWGGTALKPAWEPICLARKMLEGTVEENWRKWGTGALAIDACRVPTEDFLGGGATKETTADQKNNDGWTRPWMDDPAAREAHAARVRANVERAERLGRWPANLIHDGSEEVVEVFPADAGARSPVRGTEPSAASNGNSTNARDRVAGVYHADAGSAARFFYCAKPSQRERNEGLDSYETVIVEASFNLESPTWENEAHKVRLLVASATLPPKVMSASGLPSNNATEWNTILFGNEPTGLFQKGSMSTIETRTNSTTGLTILSYFQNCHINGSILGVNYETGSGGNRAANAGSGTLLVRTTNARMALALGAEHVASPMLLRISANVLRSEHPTVKPIALMRYLCRLVTPPGGTVVDPWCGSGSTGVAAVQEGFGFLGFEREAQYVEIAEARIAHARSAS